MDELIYLSAAAHATDNKTKCAGNCGENLHCNKYMDKVEAGLKRCGFNVKRGDPAKTGSAAMTERVAEANRLKATLYYVAHTNAGGGRYSMTMCYPNAASKAKANILHKHRKCVQSHKVKARADLYEITATAMPCLYDELFFHDNAEDCAWFHGGGMEALAEETVAALCEICGVAYTAAETPAEKPAEKAPAAGDPVTLKGGRLYTTARGDKYVLRTGTFYLYDGQKVGGRYRVTNRADRVGKKPVAFYVSGWAEVKG